MVEFDFRDADNKLVCLLNGHFGADVNVSFAARLTEKIEHCRTAIPDPGKLNVCFDMKHVDFIASAFIRTCLSTARQVDQENFSIINTSPMIKKTFKIAGLEEMLHVR